MKYLLFIFLIVSLHLSAQFPEKDTSNYSDSMLTKVYGSVRIIPNFQWRYQIALKRVRRVYPMALEAARVIDSLNVILEETHKKRKRKKIEKNANQKLKEEFKFMVKDLYQSEGRVLTKLIFRETGMTVRQILNKYRSNFTGMIYSTMAGFFNQDLDAMYQPQSNTDDYIIECVIRDIQSGKVAFDPTIKGMSKDEYKQSMKEYRQNKRANRKKNRKLKKAARKNKKAAAHSNE